MASKHLVIDGSNIATEGRSLPSLAQLDEAVQAFLRERPHDTYTVVVDATFGHRIDASEKAMYEEALAANEMITPPAGTIGRGDKFLLEIADRANATVFSNDSFQEFHGEYEWLFEPGRLIGGKPVPQVGWIFTERTPVRGPRSRMASRAAGERRGRLTASSGRVRRSPLSDLPVAVPSAPPPRRRLSAVRSAAPTPGAPSEESAAASADGPVTAAVAEPAEPRRRRRAASSPEPVNPPLAFIEFIAEHVPGSTVEGEVVSFTSHGAFVQVGDVRCYLALKFMGDPPPKSARDVLSRGEVRSFVVQALDPPRRGIDLALPGCEVTETPEAPEPAESDASELTDVASPPVRTRRRSLQAPPAPAATVEEPAQTDEPAPGEEAAAAPVARRRRRLRSDPAAASPPAAVAPAAFSAVDEQGAAPVAARRRRSSPRQAAVEAGSEPAPSVGGDRLDELVPVTTPATKRSTRRAAPPVEIAAEPSTERAAASPERTEPATERAPAKKVAVKKAAVKQALLEEAPAKKAAAKKAPAKKAAAKKAPAKKAPAKKAPAKKASADTAPAEDAATVEPPAKKAPAKKAVTKKAATKRAATKKATAVKEAGDTAPAKKVPARRRVATVGGSASEAPPG